MTRIKNYTILSLVLTGLLACWFTQEISIVIWYCVYLIILFAIYKIAKQKTSYNSIVTKRNNLVRDIVKLNREEEECQDKGLKISYNIQKNCMYLYLSCLNNRMNNNEHCDINMAIEALKHGSRVYRKSWEDGKYLVVHKDSVWCYTKEMIISYTISLNDGTKWIPTEADYIARDWVINVPVYRDTI